MVEPLLYTDHPLPPDTLDRWSLFDTAYSSPYENSSYIGTLHYVTEVDSVIPLPNKIRKDSYSLWLSAYLAIVDFRLRMKEDMPLWRLQRHTVYLPSTQDIIEAWGIDRPAPDIPSGPAGGWVDASDPLGQICPLMVYLRDGSLVTWSRMMLFLSEIQEYGYKVLSDVGSLNPLIPIVIEK